MVSPLDAKAKEMAERLRDGVQITGDMSGEVELYDIDAAETTMADAADLITAQAERIAELERERDEARALVSEANNSLYGSQSYFHSMNGGVFDKWHLARGIENLKCCVRSAGAEVRTLREALTDATAHLLGAASAYEKYASRHRSIGRAVADPLFTTRLQDFKAAAERSSATLRAKDPS